MGRNAPPELLDVRVSSDGVRVPVSRARVASLALAVLRWERCPSASLAITFVSRRAIARLNRRHMGHAGATDIVTFEHARPSPAFPRVGDIYIAPEIAREHARVFGAGVREEVARLVVHGVLHALGMDHPEGAARLASPMWKRQERWLARARAAGVV